MANEPITRQEQLLNAVATGEAANIEPITREEMFLAKLGGADVNTPTPITRKEQFLQMIVDNGTGGGGAVPSGTIKISENGNYNVTAFARAEVDVPERIPIINALEVSKNGTYTTSNGVDGYNPVVVNVPTEAVNNQNKTITENGTYTADAGYTGLGEVVVNVASSGGGGEVAITDARYLFRSGARLDSKESLCSAITSDCANFESMFEDCFTVDSIPNLNTSNGTAFTEMFKNCKQLTSIPNLDTSKGTEFGSMFYSDNSLTSIPNLNTSNGTTFSSMFRYCHALTSIPNLDLNKGTSLNYVFQDCKALTDLYLYNIRKSITIASGTSYGHLLTVDSLVHTIKELCTVSSGQTLTIGNTNLAKISGLYCKITDNTHEKKPMELCESTDEGAMTLVDYAAEKNWSIA